MATFKTYGVCVFVVMVVGVVVARIDEDFEDAGEVLLAATTIAGSALVLAGVLLLFGQLVLALSRRLP